MSQIMNFNSLQFPSLKFNYEFGKKTWFGSGGNCRYFLRVDSLKQLRTTLKIGKI